MRLEEDSNQIIVEETPGCLWLFGMFFALIGGTFIYGSVGGFVNWNAVPVWQLLLAFLMGAIAVGVGVWIVHRAPATRVVVNRQTEIVTHERRGIFGNQTRNYAFDSLKHFSLIGEDDGDGALIWSLAMELNDGETIKISSMPSHSQQFKRDFVFQINQFLGKPIPSYKTADQLEDESETEIG